MFDSKPKNQVLGRIVGIDSGFHWKNERREVHITSPADTEHQYEVHKVSLHGLKVLHDFHWIHENDKTTKLCVKTDLEIIFLSLPTFFFCLTLFG